MALWVTLFATAGTCTIDGIEYYYVYKIHEEVAPGESFYSGHAEVKDGKAVTGTVVIPAVITVDGDVRVTVTSIQGHAFQGNEAITKVSVPSGVTHIDTYAFDGCTNLETVTIDGSLKSIGDYAFRRCGALKAIDLTNGIGTIGEYAFQKCVNMRSALLPSEGLTSLGTCCFVGCSSLASLTIPGSVRTIGNYVCQGCTGMKEVVIELGSNRWVGSNYFLNCTGLVKATISWYEELPSQMFKGCTNLKTVVLNNTKRISSYVFENCTSLESVTVPNTVQEIGIGAFKNCSSLKAIDLPNSITELSTESFMGCSSLRQIAVPEGVTILPKNVFRDCGSLESMTLPSGLTEIGNSALWGCSALTKLELPSTLQKVLNSALVSCRSLKVLTFPSAMTTMEPNMFYGCKGLRLIDLRACSKLSIKDTRRDSGNSNLVFRDVPESTVILMPGEEVAKEVGPGIQPPAIEVGDAKTVVIVKGDEGYWCPAFDMQSTESLSIPVDFVADVVTNSRAIPSDANAYTLCLPYDYDLPAGVKAYSYDSSDSEGNLVFTEASGIEANKPYLVVASSGVANLNAANVTLKATPATMPAAGSAEFEFRGTLEKIDNEAAAAMRAFILQANKEWHPVSTSNPNAYIAAGRAYIVPKTNNARLRLSTVFDDGGATGIKIVAKDGNQTYYNLQGRRIDKPSKGVYVVKGKKIVGSK